MRSSENTNCNQRKYETPEQTNNNNKMVNFLGSPRSVATPANPDALNLASPNRDINAIVEDAAKRFEEMDDDLKSLIQDMKNYQTSMVQLNENRLKVSAD